MMIQGSQSPAAGRVYTVNAPGNMQIMSITNRTNWFLRFTLGGQDDIIPPWARLGAMLQRMDERAHIEVLNQAADALRSDEGIDVQYGSGSPGVVMLASASMFKQQGEVIP